jgi:hypothetical protein
MESVETDYLVVGAGAMGLAFADEILSQKPTAKLVLVDQHARPGGHWNDAYPFVSLHQPAAYYGVSSMKLGSGGAYLASGAEVLAYYEHVIRAMLDTGRVVYMPQCRHVGSNRIESLLTPGKSVQVHPRVSRVDATYMNVQVPATTPPKYAVAASVDLVPPNALTRVDEPRSRYVVIGGGKTGIDAVLFLLGQGVGQESITWVVPNDAWLLERSFIQPGRALKWVLSQYEVFLSANSTREVFQKLEEAGILCRLSNEVEPVKYRCATVSAGELARLGEVTDVVRMGRVTSVEPGRMVLERGTVELPDDTLYVDCTANPLAKRDAIPVFSDKLITLQSLVMCQQVFSAAVIANVECNFDSLERKNALCHPVPHPELATDFLPAMLVSMNNTVTWSRTMMRWLARCRLWNAHHESLFATLWIGSKVNRMRSRVEQNINHLITAREQSDTRP